MLSDQQIFDGVHDLLVEELLEEEDLPSKAHGQKGKQEHRVSAEEQFGAKLRLVKLAYKQLWSQAPDRRLPFDQPDPGCCAEVQRCKVLLDPDTYPDENLQFRDIKNYQPDDPRVRTKLEQLREAHWKVVTAAAAADAAAAGLPASAAAAAAGCHVGLGFGGLRGVPELQQLIAYTAADVARLVACRDDDCAAFTDAEVGGRLPGDTFDAKGMFGMHSLLTPANLVMQLHPALRLCLAADVAAGLLCDRQPPPPDTPEHASALLLFVWRALANIESECAPASHRRYSQLWFYEPSLTSLQPLLDFCASLPPASAVEGLLELVLALQHCHSAAAGADGGGSSIGSTPDRNPQSVVEAAAVVAAAAAGGVPGAEAEGAGAGGAAAASSRLSRVLGCQPGAEGAQASSAGSLAAQLLAPVAAVLPDVAPPGSSAACKSQMNGPHAGDGPSSSKSSNSSSNKSSSQQEEQPTDAQAASQPGAEAAAAAYSAAAAVAHRLAAVAGAAVVRFLLEAQAVGGPALAQDVPVQAALLLAAVDGLFSASLHELQEGLNLEQQQQQQQQHDAAARGRIQSELPGQQLVNKLSQALLGAKMLDFIQMLRRFREENAAKNAAAAAAAAEAAGSPDGGSLPAQAAAAAGASCSAPSASTDAAGESGGSSGRLRRFQAALKESFLVEVPPPLVGAVPAEPGGPLPFDLWAAAWQQEAAAASGLGPPALAGLQQQQQQQGEQASARADSSGTVLLAHDAVHAIHHFFELLQLAHKHNVFEPVIAQQAGSSSSSSSSSSNAPCSLEALLSQHTGLGLQMLLPALVPLLRWQSLWAAANRRLGDMQTFAHYEFNSLRHEKIKRVTQMRKRKRKAAAAAAALSALSTSKAAGKISKQDLRAAKAAALDSDDSLFGSGSSSSSDDSSDSDGSGASGERGPAAARKRKQQQQQQKKAAAGGGGSSSSSKGQEKKEKPADGSKRREQQAKADSIKLRPDPCAICKLEAATAAASSSSSQRQQYVPYKSWPVDWQDHSFWRRLLWQLLGRLKPSAQTWFAELGICPHFAGCDVWHMVAASIARHLWSLPGSDAQSKEMQQLAVPLQISSFSPSRRLKKEEARAGQVQALAAQLNQWAAASPHDATAAGATSLQVLLALDPHAQRVQPDPDLLFFTPPGFGAAVSKTLMTAAQPRSAEPCTRWCRPQLPVWYVWWHLGLADYAAQQQQQQQQAQQGDRQAHGLADAAMATQHQQQEPQEQQQGLSSNDGSSRSSAANSSSSKPAAARARQQQGKKKPAGQQLGRSARSAQQQQLRSANSTDELLAAEAANAADGASATGSRPASRASSSASSASPDAAPPAADAAADAAVGPAAAPAAACPAQGSLYDDADARVAAVGYAARRLASSEQALLLLRNQPVALGLRLPVDAWLQRRLAGATECSACSKPLQHLEVCCPMCISYVFCSAECAAASFQAHLQHGCAGAWQLENVDSQQKAALALLAAGHLAAAAAKDVAAAALAAAAAAVKAAAAAANEAAGRQQGLAAAAAAVAEAAPPDLAALQQRLSAADLMALTARLEDSSGQQRVTAPAQLAVMLPGTRRCFEHTWLAFRLLTGGACSSSSSAGAAPGLLPPGHAWSALMHLRLTRQREAVAERSLPLAAPRPFAPSGCDVGSAGFIAARLRGLYRDQLHVGQGLVVLDSMSDISEVVTRVSRRRTSSDGCASPGAPGGGRQRLQRLHWAGDRDLDEPAADEAAAGGGPRWLPDADDGAGEQLLPLDQSDPGRQQDWPQQDWPQQWQDQQSWDEQQVPSSDLDIWPVDEEAAGVDGQAAGELHSDDSSSSSRRWWAAGGDDVAPPRPAPPLSPEQQRQQQQEAALQYMMREQLSDSGAWAGMGQGAAAGEQSHDSSSSSSPVGSGGGKAAVAAQPVEDQEEQQEEQEDWATANGRLGLGFDDDENEQGEQQDQEEEEEHQHHPLVYEVD